MLAAFRGECVCLIMWTSRRILVKETGTVASGELHGPGDHCEGREGKSGGKEGEREGCVSTCSPSG